MALPTDRNDREMQKFVENSASEVAVRVVATDAAGADITVADDAAFTPTTSVVTPVGFFADETATDSVNEGDTGAARMTLNRRQITADQFLDDGAFTITTDYVGVIGGYADETTTDSVSEGDVGALRMTLDRRLITASNILDDAALGVGTSYVTTIAGFADETAPDSVGEGDVGAVRMTLDRKLHTSSSHIDDGAYTITTDYCNVIGAYADETTPDSVSEADAGALRMTLDRKLHTSANHLDDAAVGIGTDYASVIGALVDDTAPDSVDEGDAGFVRMSADRLLYVQGALAHSAVDAGNPLKIGGIARSTQSTAVTALDRTDAIFNLNGEAVAAGHTWATNSNRGEEIDPVSSHHTEETLADVTDETSAPTTNYYYMDMDGYRYFSIQCETSDATPTDVLVVTVEATNQDDGTAQASCTYQDVTQTQFGVANWTDTDFYAINSTVLPCKYVRVKTVTTGAGDDADYTIFAKRLY